MIPISVSSAVKYAVQATTGAAFIVHFALTGIFDFPLNPIKKALEPVLQSTIAEFFPQTWSLFAPSPASENYTLLVQCLDSEEYDSAQRTGELKQEWSDVTLPLQQMHQASRLSAYDHLARPQWSATTSFLMIPSDLAFLADDCKAGDKEACAVIEAATRSHRDGAAKALARIGSSFCTDTSVPGKDVRHVAMRARVHPGRPWSKRYDPEPVPDRDYELGIFPYDPTVAPSHVFLGATR